MTTEPFTPHADSIQIAWVLMCQQSRIFTQPPVEELEAEFDRFVARVRQEAKAEAWDEGHSWGWSDAQDAHDVRQVMDRADWSLKTPNPYRQETDR